MNLGSLRGVGESGRRFASWAAVLSWLLAPLQQSLDAPGGNARMPLPPSFEAPPERPLVEPSGAGNCGGDEPLGGG